MLRSKDIEVVYLEDLAAEALINEEVRRQFIDQFLEEANIRESAKEKVRELMLEIDDNEELIQKRLRAFKTKLPKYEQEFLTDMVEADYPFIIDPMPNLYFTRDNFATMGHGFL